MRKLERNEKRSITYTVITAILVMVAIKAGDESIVAYIAALGYLITGFMALLFIGNVVMKKMLLRVNNALHRAVRRG